MALTSELQESITRQRGRVDYARQILDQRTQALARLAAIEGDFHDVLWKWGAHSGPKLFEAHFWLQREVEEAKGWLKDQERKLYLLDRQAAS
jgi:hypothetical protein